MKSLKAIALTVLSVFLFTGCYTQLEYSQRMSKITETAQLNERTQSEYADNQAAEVNDANTNTSAYAETEANAYAEEDYIPVYYKDYSAANWWADCLCSPYGYNRYSAYDYWYYDRYAFRASFGFGHYGYPYYYSRHWVYHDPFLRWKLRRHHRWFHHHSFFSFSWHWGYYPYSSFHYYDPFWHHYYGYPTAYNFYYFYNTGGRFVGGGDTVGRDVNRRYGPRSFGTNRVVSDEANRVRERESISNTGSSAATIRSTGTTRSRGSATTVTRSSDTGNSSTTTRTRSRSTVKRDNDSTNNTNTVRTRSRSGGGQDVSVENNQNRRRVISLEDYVNSGRANYDEETKKRIRNSMVPASAINDRRLDNNNRKSFLKRVRSFFNNSTTYKNSSGNISVPSRTRSSSSINRSSNSTRSRSTGTSVSRSKSSSSSSGNTRSRSGGSSSSRSRGNN